MKTTVLFDQGAQVEPKREVVERKGLGHPDTLCDLIAEATSREYLRFTETNFDGRFAHHWFDKVMLIGGEARFGFGYGELTAPYNIYLVGKAAMAVGQHSIPIEEIFATAAREVLSNVLFEFDTERWLVCHSFVGKGTGPQNASGRYSPTNSVELHSPNEFKDLVSNDGNLLAAYAPLTVLERIVLDLESHLQSRSIRSEFPFVGRDLKFFATRDMDHLDVQIRLPFIAKHTPSLAFYEEARDNLEVLLRSRVADVFNVQACISVNRKDPLGSAYLTVTGSVADTGDVGVVGRGNRVNGLISPMRPQSIEAACGKNPIDHTGKLYSVLANRIASALWSRSGIASEVFVRALKHEPVHTPGAVIVRTASALTSQQEVECVQLVLSEVAQLGDYFGQFLRGEISLC